MAEFLTPDIEALVGHRLKAFEHVYRNNKVSRIRRMFWFIILGFLLLMFIPWTQNIRSEGAITTLRQEQRPQQMNNIIPGRIVKWWVKEGDYVKKGDTIVQLAEIKDDYLDPNLLQRTEQQLGAEQLTIDFYENKVTATRQQIEALENERELKLRAIDNKFIQTKRKVESDSMKVVAADNEMMVADRQLEGATQMFEKGVIPLTEFERRKVLHQNVNAKWIGAQNDFNNSRQDLLIVQLERSAAIQDYAEKIAKAQGDVFQSRSQIASGQGKVAKLQNQFDNYRIRSGQYYVIAPQDGQVIKARKSGINEIVKEGDMIVEIVPREYQLATEIWVNPMDLQLLNIGQKVRFMFDGFPAIVFSGWPAASYGTFGGKVVAIESNRSNNGMFRVLVAEDRSDRPWPKGIKIGTGAVSFALLKDVPIWYELWRQINGFPPDFYKQQEDLKKEQEKKMDKHKF
ncbi:MAG TPA: biotin/lipoyl-binding protein [Lacibacter sp.]|nr:biotin/lipoyl-binding protein [Lacibacter sp.]HMO89163.1 biotin/lipoyl-binding protein [Lacibacter sp.]HMP86546.1 biotin/lipoyl-binding protein [Lacibacter sp.]